jgi:hypothetical protein
MFPFDLGRLGNAIAWWLGQEPYELFFYVFLPPLLFDSAVRIDYFIFLRVCPSHVPHLLVLPTVFRRAVGGAAHPGSATFAGFLQVGSDWPIVIQTSVLVTCRPSCASGILVLHFSSHHRPAVGR